MGTELKNIVMVNITRETAKVTRKGFGTALVFGPLVGFTGKYRVYNTIEAVEADFNPSTEQWKAAARLFGQEIRPEQIIIGSRDTLKPLAEDLAAMAAANNDWYALMLTREGTEANQIQDIKDAAAWIEPRSKIFMASINAADMLTTAATDVATFLKNAGYDRTAILYSADHANYPEAAWLGRCLPEDPGSITWKFKSLSGIAVDDLSATSVINLKNKNANFYERVAGVNIISSEAVVASGEYLDIIRGIDWLQARISEGVYFRLINADKVAFTTQGIAVIENEIRYRLLKAVEAGLLNHGTIHIKMPELKNIDPMDKAQRRLNGVEFTAQLAGAVHKVSIQGTVTL